MDRPHPMNKRIFLLPRRSDWAEDRIDYFSFDNVGNNLDYVLTAYVSFYNDQQFNLCERVFRLANTDHWTSTGLVSY